MALGKQEGVEAALRGGVGQIFGVGSSGILWRDSQALGWSGVDVETLCGVPKQPRAQPESTDWREGALVKAFEG